MKNVRFVSLNSLKIEPILTISELILTISELICTIYHLLYRIEITEHFNKFGEYLYRALLKLDN